MILRHYLLNKYNYISLIKILIIFENPIYYLYCVIFKIIPKRIIVRTPIGKITLYLRNFESLKTIFSIFCREDYKVTNNKSHFIDIGSNCGYSCVYFLSRNNRNTIDCYEPEIENMKFLKKNLEYFSNRSNIYELAIGTENGIGKLYTSSDGKYSSLIEQVTQKSYSVKVVSFESLLRKISNEVITQIKIDIEGLEKEIIKKINFHEYKNISKLIIESTECSELIEKNHKRLLINGYVEHISFY